MIAKLLVKKVMVAIAATQGRNRFSLHQILENSSEVFKRITLSFRWFLSLVPKEHHFWLDYMVFSFLFLVSVLELGFDEVLQSWLVFMPQANMVDQGVRAEVRSITVAAQPVATLQYRTRPPWRPLHLHLRSHRLCIYLIGLIHELFNFFHDVLI